MLQSALFFDTHILCRSAPLCLPLCRSVHRSQSNRRTYAFLFRLFRRRIYILSNAGFHFASMGTIHAHASIGRCKQHRLILFRILQASSRQTGIRHGRSAVKFGSLRTLHQSAVNLIFKNVLVCNAVRISDRKSSDQLPFLFALPYPNSSYTPYPCVAAGSATIYPPLLRRRIEKFLHDCSKNTSSIGMFSLYANGHDLTIGANRRFLRRRHHHNGLRSKICCSRCSSW